MQIKSKVLVLKSVLKNVPLNMISQAFSNCVLINFWLFFFFVGICVYQRILIVWAETAKQSCAFWARCSTCSLIICSYAHETQQVLIY